MSDRKQWETSTTGGPVVGVTELARLLGFSDTYVRKMLFKWGLRPANPYNPNRRNQHIKLYVADVQDLLDHPERLTEDKENPNTAAGAGHVGAAA